METHWAVSSDVVIGCGKTKNQSEGFQLIGSKESWWACFPLCRSSYQALWVKYHNTNTFRSTRSEKPNSNWRDSPFNVPTLQAQLSVLYTIGAMCWLEWSERCMAWIRLYSSLYHLIAACSWNRKVYQQQAHYPWEQYCNRLNLYWYERLVLQRDFKSF